MKPINLSEKAIQGETVKELVENTFAHLKRHGTKLNLYGQDRSISRSTVMVLNNPVLQEFRYPFFNQAEESWYLNHFVTDQVPAPESLEQPIVFPYTYSWRSIYQDQGWGHVLAVINLLNQLNYTDLPFTRQEDFDQLVKETYRYYHPDLIFATLLWLGRDKTHRFMTEPLLVKELVEKTRHNVLDLLTNQIIKNPTSRWAITPSFIYANLDHSMMMTSIPVYQSFHVLVNFDEKSEPVGFEAFRYHRTFHLNPTLQLDIAHDLEWSRILSEKLGIPISRLTIYTDEIYMAETQQFEKIDVKHWLIKTKNGYEPDSINIEHFLRSEAYLNKVSTLLNSF